MANPWCVQKPTKNAKQREFVADFRREILYGGAAGGGKSSALLMAAAQFVECPNYAALILRRTYADLALPGALIDRAQQWWGDLTVGGQRARWNAQKHSWTFPSGATITFGYLEKEKDKYRYQSSEFDFIGWDELTQFAESQYRYLFSRVRRNKGSPIPSRVRGGTNPGGVGHGWVKRRFIKEIDETLDRAFIRAKLDDNPHLDREDYLRSLAELDPVTRKQLEEGNWDEFKGGRFRSEWLRYYSRDNYWYVFTDKLRYHEEQLTNRFLTVDPAASVKEVSKPDPDYTVISSWVTTPCGLLVAIGCWRDRVEVPDIAPRMAEQYLRHKCGLAVIESGSTQKGVYQLARRHKLSGQEGHFMNCTEYIPVKDKLDFSTDAQNMAQAGRIWLPLDDPTFPLEDVETEVVAFTGNDKTDSHDDIVTTWSMAAKRVTRREDDGGAKTFKFQALGVGGKAA